MHGPSHRNKATTKIHAIFSKLFFHSPHHTHENCMKFWSSKAAPYEIPYRLLSKPSKPRNAERAQLNPHNTDVPHY